MEGDEVRKIHISVELMNQLSTRDDDGNRLSVDWGEPDADGFYAPAISIDFADNPLKARIDEAAWLLENCEGAFETGPEGFMDEWDRRYKAWNAPQE